MKALSLVTILFLTTSCASLFQERTFIREMDKESDGTWTPHEDFHVIPGDQHDGYRTREQIASRTPGAKINTLEDSLQRELSVKEKSLTMEQYAEYSEIKPDLDTISEKIYFLNLSVDEREEYLSSRQLGKYAVTNRPSRGRRSAGYREPASMPIANSFSYGRNIYQGMAKEEVRSSWGRPTRVDVAGDPRNQNERWTFYENGKIKQVFFEGGVVQGWALE